MESFKSAAAVLRIVHHGTWAAFGYRAWCGAAALPGSGISAGFRDQADDTKGPHKDMLGKSTFIPSPMHVACAQVSVLACKSGPPPGRKRRLASLHQALPKRVTGVRYSGIGWHSRRV